MVRNQSHLFGKHVLSRNHAAILIGVLMAILPCQLHAQSPEKVEIDPCSLDILTFAPNNDLSPQEQVEILDNIFFESLARFDQCQMNLGEMNDTNKEQTSRGKNAVGNNSADNTSLADNANDADSSNGNGVDSENAGIDAIQSDAAGQSSPLQASTPVAGISGSDLPTNSANAPQKEQENQSMLGDAKQGAANASPDEVNAGKRRPDGSPPLPHGAVPDDIPAGNDDDLLQAQIRAAAMAEPDPKLRAKLWNEYRKYKGLPAKDL